MPTFLTDVHTHSTYSPDGISTLDNMLQTALEKGVAFYGVREHINYDMLVAEEDGIIDRLDGYLTLKGLRLLYERNR